MDGRRDQIGPVRLNGSAHLTATASQERAFGTRLATAWPAERAGEVESPGSNERTPAGPYKIINCQKKGFEMESRGRKSAASLSVISPGHLQAVRRPDPPSDLTDEQAREWIDVVSRLPADWFPRETHGLLVSYCRHVVSGRRVAQLIEAQEDSETFDVDEYDKLLKMQERESRALASLATRMRLSQQSTYIPTKKKPGQTRKPWEDGD